MVLNMCLKQEQTLGFIPRRVDFRRWQKKMHFLLSSMSVVYVLTTLIPEDGGDDATVEQIRKKAKWDNDGYVCRGLILNGNGYHTKDKKKAKQQNQARDGKDKDKSKPKSVKVKKSTGKSTPKKSEVK
ncbi:hypothetical protein Tco_1508579 [Tanacetum coccineum]